MSNQFCLKCGDPIHLGEEEYCWYCMGTLCVSCWDKYGHCGHPAAEAENRRARNHKPGDPLEPMPMAPPEEMEQGAGPVWRTDD